jgi:hypothetical protein
MLILIGRIGVTLVIITAIGVIDTGGDSPPSMVFAGDNVPVTIAAGRGFISGLTPCVLAPELAPN